MSPSQIFEPTYKAIKGLLMAGAMASGTRLDTAKLARHLGVSTSPVRDSLNRLAGEGLVDFIIGEGFQVPKLDAYRLENMLDLSLTLMLSTVPDQPAVWAVITTIEGSAVERAAGLFHGMAFLTGNHELTKAVDSLGLRLSPMRVLDEQVLAEPRASLDRLQAAIRERRHPVAIREALEVYHSERRSQSGYYARLLAQPRDGDRFPPSIKEER